MRKKQIENNKRIVMTNNNLKLHLMTKITITKLKSWSNYKNSNQRAKMLKKLQHLRTKYKKQNSFWRTILRNKSKYLSKNLWFSILRKYFMWIVRKWLVEFWRNVSKCFQKQLLSLFKLLKKLLIFLQLIKMDW